MKHISMFGLVSALGVIGFASTGVRTQSGKRGWGGILSRVLLGMRTPLRALGVAGTICLSGCASTRQGVALMQPETPLSAGAIHVGLARVVDARVNAAVGVHVAADGDAVVVRFAHPRQGAEVRLDSTSLDVRSVTTDGIKVGHSTVNVQPDRVALDGGTFIVCWNEREDAESPDHAVVQASNAADGLPRGAPVVISPPDVDVIGTPRAVKIDGHHAVVMFVADTGGSFALYAVAVDSI
jgi:hypothetical protein